MVKREPIPAYVTTSFVFIISVYFVVIIFVGVNKSYILNVAGLAVSIISYWFLTIPLQFLKCICFNKLALFSESHLGF